MSDPQSNRTEHWQRVYDKPEHAVSWYQPHAKSSLRLIDAANLSSRDALIDVGGGASTLVDGLVARDYLDTTVLDVSERSLSVAKQRLGALAARVRWIVGDVTSWEPAREYRLWHDRAVFHFLTDPNERRAYLDRLARAVPAGGAVVLATFAADGPERCSGLPVQRYSLSALEAELRPVAKMVEARKELHTTPSGTQQSFLFARLLRTSSA